MSGAPGSDLMAWCASYVYFHDVGAFAQAHFIAVHLDARIICLPGKSRKKAPWRLLAHACMAVLSARSLYHRLGLPI